ncbi:hypothetical protein TWF696_001196 [Orbilia brochopaga]|uniref:Monopolin complex subunit Csm1/Pcs1 C-terminal domain-containing protein n=1 Tax=Orbilia brochopaga TaxID=3140254 RepID=A0AAV9UCD5_9PEZI
MPPRRAPKTSLASHLASSPFSSSDDERDTKPASKPAASVESSAIKKSRGRPRKQSISAATPNRVIDTQTNTDETMSKAKTKPGAKSSAKARGGRVDDTPRQAVAETGMKRRKRGSHGVLTKIEEDGETDLPDADAPPAKRRATKSSRAAPSRKKAVDPGPEIPETQVGSRIEDEGEDEDVESALGEQEDEPQAGSRKPAPIRSSEEQSYREELEQLRARYQKLRHLKIDEAEAIHKEQILAFQQQDKAAQRIIDNLKAELEAKSIAHQTLLQKNARIEQLEQENTIMEKKIERLVQDHAILSAKLEAARNQAKPPSNTAKASGSAAFTKEFSQHRDNLYSDLCGLIVLNVKNDEDGGIEYDCLSTGRNGALHFKLQLDAEDEDEDEDDGPYFTYNPMLERGRDERLLAVLPPIFRDEMNFKRTRGVDFYLQLMQSLQAS